MLSFFVTFSVLASNTLNSVEREGTMEIDILHVDDETEYLDDFKEGVLRHLTSKSLAARVRSVTGPTEALDEVHEKTPDIIFLDMRMGKDDQAGLSLLREIRSFDNDTPIIMVTNFDDEVNVSNSLREYADHVCAKKFKLILDRLDGVLGRHVLPRHCRFTPFPGSSLVIERGVVRWKGKTILLRGGPEKLVRCLCQDPGRPYSRDEVLNFAEAGENIEIKTVDVWVKRARELFNRVESNSDPIQTEWGVGYSWSEEAR